MFTGIVEDLGEVMDIQVRSEGGLLRVKTSLGDIDLGDSVAVNGACLTVVDLSEGSITFEVSGETFSRTNLRYLRRGDRVNLERALKVSSRLGGHLVLGHVDFTARIVEFSRRGDHRSLVLEIPSRWIKFFVEKGSVAVDGISLTVNYVEGRRIHINVVPFTLSKTNLSFRKVGDLVNVEADIIGKYVVSYMSRMSDGDLESKLKSFLGV